MIAPSRLLDVLVTLTPDDHQTHRRYVFEVPPDCQELQFWVRYSPKHLTEQESSTLIEAAVVQQTGELAKRVGEATATQWSAGLGRPSKGSRVANLLTISLDDAEKNYRGAGHRQSNDQRLAVGRTTASPGLVAGPLPPGVWTLTLSAHTLVSAQCELSIQIDAEIASSC